MYRYWRESVCWSGLKLMAHAFSRISLKFQLHSYMRRHFSYSHELFVTPCLAFFALPHSERNSVVEGMIYVIAIFRNLKRKSKNCRQNSKNTRRREPLWCLSEEERSRTRVCKHQFSSISSLMKPSAPWSMLVEMSPILTLQRFSIRCRT